MYNKQRNKSKHTQTKLRIMFILFTNHNLKLKLNSRKTNHSEQGGHRCSTLYGKGLVRHKGCG